MKTSLICIVLALAATTILAAPRQNAIKTLRQTKGSEKSAELIEAIKKAAEDAQAAIKRAEADLQSALAGQDELLAALEAILRGAAQQAQTILGQALTDIEQAGSLQEAIAIVLNAASELKAVAASAVASAQQAAAGSGVEEAVTQILNNLEVDLLAAIKPVIDLIAGGSGSKLSLRSSELIAALKQAVADAQVALQNAREALESELAGQGELAARLEAILNGAGQQVENIVVRAVEALAAATSLEQAQQILEQAVNDLEAVAQSAVAEAEAAVADSGIVGAVEQILRDLEANLRAAIQPVIDIISGAGRRQ